MSRNRVETDPDPLAPSVSLSPEAVLAARIIRQALADAVAGDPSIRAKARAAARANARQFLRGGLHSDLEFWLSVLGLDPPTRAGLRERIARVLNGRGKP